MKLWPMPRARMKVSAPRLLVLEHGVENRVGGDAGNGDVRDARRQSDRARMRLDARGVLDMTAPLPAHIRKTFDLFGFDAKQYELIEDAPEQGRAAHPASIACGNIFPADPPIKENLSR